MKDAQIQPLHVFSSFFQFEANNFKKGLIPKTLSKIGRVVNKPGVTSNMYTRLVNFHVITSRNKRAK